MRVLRGGHLADGNLTKPKRRLRPRALTWAVAALCALAPVTGLAQQISFGLIGDISYFPEAWIERVLNDVDKDRSLSFVAQLGGLARPALACTDSLLFRRREQFRSSIHPIVYTPGDKEWADCPGEGANSANALERLAMIRKTFFDVDQDFGLRLGVVRQASASEPAFRKYRENGRWNVANITFATLHVVGGNNNLGRTTSTDEEFRERLGAALAWLREGFAHAKRNASGAIVIMAQGNIFRSSDVPGGKRRPSGYFRIRDTIAQQASAFGRPVIVAHGEPKDNGVEVTNQHRNHSNIHLVDTFGEPDRHWIRISIDTKSSAITISPRIPLDLSR